MIGDITINNLTQTTTKPIDAQVGQFVRANSRAWSLETGKTYKVTRSYDSQFQTIGIDCPAGGTGFYPSRFDAVFEERKVAKGDSVKALVNVGSVAANVSYVVTNVYADGSIVVTPPFTNGLRILPGEFKREDKAVRFAKGTTIYLAPTSRAYAAKEGAVAVVREDTFEDDRTVYLDWVDGPASGLRKTQSHGNYPVGDFSTEKPQARKGDVKVGAWVGDETALDSLPTGSIIVATASSDKTPLAKRTDGTWIVASAISKTDYRNTFIKNVLGVDGFTLVHYGTGY